MSMSLSFSQLALVLGWLAGDIYVDQAANCAAANGTAAAPYCTLAEALQAAVDGDRILMAPGQYTGPHVIGKDVAIIGAGESLGGTTLAGTLTAPLLTVSSGRTVSIEGVRMSDGYGFPSRPGTIDNYGTLTLRNSTITDGDGFGTFTSSIYQRSGSGGLTLEGCTVLNNYLNSSSGALLRSRLGGAITIRGSSFHANRQYLGPVIYAFGTQLLIEDTTFSDNDNYAAPVIQLLQSGLVMRNSTISANFGFALSSGAAGGTQRLENCTISGNALGQVLHGIDSLGPSRVQLRNTIVEGGHPPAQTNQTLRGAFTSLGYNLIDNGTGSTGLTDGVNGDQVGTAAAPIPAGLGPLTLGPGFGRTHTPNSNSRALDAGSLVTFLAFDQHGFPRIPGGADIGAVERPLGSVVPGCTAAVNSTGNRASIFATGAFDVGADTAELRAAGVPPAALGLFLASLSAASPVTPPGSSGVLCLGGAIGRFVGVGQVQNASAGGTLRLDLDLLNFPQPTGSVAVVAGQAWHFQAWFRDALGGQATSNLSNAVVVTWQ